MPFDTFTPNREVTFVPGESPADGYFALWRRGERNAPAPAGETIELVLPAGRRVRRTTVPIAALPLTEAIPALVALPPDAPVTASTASWAVATQLAVDLVTRGRLHPAAARRPGATRAAWRVGPLDPTDHDRLVALAQAMPPEAHALPIEGVRPLRIRSAAALVAEFYDAVADRLVRTSAAPVAGGGPLATTRPEPLDPGADAELVTWLATAGGGHEDRAHPGLRLTLPDGPDGDFTAVLQLRSQLDPSLVVDAADLWRAPAAVLARLGDDADTALLLALRRAARVWEPAGRLLEAARPEVLALDDEEAAHLLGAGAEDLRSAGLEVLWPAELTTDRVQLRAVMGTPAPAGVAAPRLRLGDLLDVRWEAVLGDGTLTLEELDALADAKRPLVRLRGRWVLADPTLAERLRRRPRKATAIEALAAALQGAISVAGDDGDERVPVRVEGAVAILAARLGGEAEHDQRELRELRELPEPPGLTATLRPYQRRGLAWLAEMYDLGLGGCLADDMGLGKTLQTLALHLHLRTNGHDGHGPTLVVCPATLLGNWEREAARFTPGVPVRRYHGGDRHLEDLGIDEIVLTTYGVIRRDREPLAKIAWGLVAADEAQHAKNPLSRTARELRAIPGSARIALTGTPVENRLTELWAILDWTTPGLLGPLATFRRRVAVPVERHRDPEATQALARLVRPFLLRRRKSDPGIAPELPPKTETDEIAPLTAEQITLYEAVVRETMAEIAGSEGIGRRGLVLKLLTALKQVCNHPAQYLGQPGPLVGRSGKLAALDELLEVMVDAGESVLVFTQYVAMARLLERHLAARRVSTLFLHGGLAARRRDDLVDRFQAGDAPVFLLSLKAGGTGLNLTRATHVVHYDRWWNPAVEDQASDRAWRIGQDHPVQVHRLITEGTVEDRIGTMLASKRELADAVVGSGEAWLSELSNAELAALVELRRDA